MKFLLSLSLSFLLFAAASSNASSFAEAPTAEGPTAPDGPTPPPILDATGAPLQFGAPYYMLPAMWAWGGGVSLADATPLQPCPNIQLSPAETDRGTPVVFTSAVQNVTGNITIGSELIISFYNLTKPNAQYCGESNSTTWVTTRTWNLAIGGEEMSTVFRLSLGGVAHSYLLKPVSPFKKLEYVVGLDENKNLVVELPELRINLSFVFQKAKAEEDEDDKSKKYDKVIQLPRKFSV